VDNFWLASQHHQIENVDKITDDARISLVVEQCSDLQDKYGQLLGSRLARSAVIAALDEDTNEMVGMATLKETLFVHNTELLESEKAEAIAKNAVAALGPKQRRLYKNAPMSVIATELLSPDTQAVCVLSNLAVSSKARRRGVANVICDEMEALASDWNFDSIHLLVERDNAAARKLYEDKLGYKKVSFKESAPALRVDVDNGEFVETTADTLILAKTL
jgi:ribosomal protein S18 acetylase RimI-like enzyme